MNRLFIAAFACLFLAACRHKEIPIVQSQLLDSLMRQIQPSETEKMVAGNLSFWKNRLDSFPDNDIFKQQYANTLVQRFHLYGNMNDLRLADSMLQAVNNAYKQTDAGIQRSLAAICISRHRFGNALQFATNAVAIGSNKYVSSLVRFDALLELGLYAEANKVLKSCYDKNEYGYFFRASKWEHYQGNIDSAIAYMLKAAALAQDGSSAKPAALSNAADLYFHNGQLRLAHDLYLSNITINKADFHSWQGIGRIAMLHDKNDSLAGRIFAYQAAYTQSPDALYNQVWLAEAENDPVKEAALARQFVGMATDTVYGNMYNKYLIELYTGILAQPAKALALAEKEMTNRSTPQSYAWYAWALHCNHLDDRANDICSKYVSGRPLEPLELYYMGKMKKEEGKGYDAQQFLSAALLNKYDLSPGKQMEVEELIK